MHPCSPTPCSPTPCSPTLCSPTPCSPTPVHPLCCVIRSVRSKSSSVIYSTWCPKTEAQMTSGGRITQLHPPYTGYTPRQPITTPPPPHTHTHIFPTVSRSSAGDMVLLLLLCFVVSAGSGCSGCGIYGFL